MARSLLMSLPTGCGYFFRLEIPENFPLKGNFK